MAASSTLSLEPVDKIDRGEEATARSGADTTSCDRDRQMRLARARPPNQDDIALLSDEVAASQSAHEAFIDRCPLVGEVVDILGKRQFGDCQLIFDRARLLLGYLSFEQVADKVLRLMLAFDRGGESLIVSIPHPIEFEFAHHVEDFGSFHDHALLS